MADASATTHPGPHIVGELGLQTYAAGETFRGRSEVLAEACVPGTEALRTSVLATWADIVTGYAAMIAVAPRIPLTLDLEVQVVEPARAGSVVMSEAEITKAGRSIVMTQTPFRDEATGRLLAVAVVTFMASPNPDHEFEHDNFVPPVWEQRLAVPLAERIGSRIVEPGVAEVPRRPDGLNATGAIQGGIVAFAAEEAATSLVDEPALLEVFHLRYLRPFMVGPARAQASGDARLAQVRLTDAGTGKLGATATARLMKNPRP